MAAEDEVAKNLPEKSQVHQYPAVAATPPDEKVLSVSKQPATPDDIRTLRSARGCDPLPNPGHEALAQYLAAPTWARPFQSFTALAANFGVARMTVHRWKIDRAVVHRAEYLSRRNNLQAVLLARSSFDRVVQVMIQKALEGDVAAAKFIQAVAFPPDAPGESFEPNEPLIVTQRIVVITEDTPPKNNYNGVPPNTSASAVTPNIGSS